MIVRTIAILGATGNLGRHVADQAIARGWSLAVAVRNRSRLAFEVAQQAQITDLDLDQATASEIAAFAAERDVLVCCAGNVVQGDDFVKMFDKVVSAVESLSSERRPICWFLAGAAVLTLDAGGRRGIDLPKVRDVYWPHKKNFERLQRSDIDWRLLCPGPMVHQPMVGTEHLRITLDDLPAPLPAFASALPGALVLLMFGIKIPQMIIAYGDAAAVILANSQRSDPCARHRLGIALPVGMRGQKGQWSARP